MLYCKRYINLYRNRSQPEDERRHGDIQRESITYAHHSPLISAIKQRRTPHVMDDTGSRQKVSPVAGIPQKPQVDVRLQYIVTGGVFEGETGYIEYKESVSWRYR